jgi:hypothetical protein
MVIEYFNTLWLDLFQNFVNICSDERFEVQKTAIITFGDIYLKKYAFISNDVSIMILNHFISILDKSFSKYEGKFSQVNKKIEEEVQIKTPKFNSV